MIQALLCKRCSGSLPAPGDDSPFVACPYCGTNHMIAAPRVEIPQVPQGPSDYEKRQLAMKAAWDNARAHAKDPLVALRAACAAGAYQLTTEQEVERAARLAESAITSFDRENQTQALFEQMSVIRVVEASHKAIIELRAVQSTELNLPFLTATTRGPVHLQQTISRATLEKLDQLKPLELAEVATPSPAPVTEPEPPKKKKKKWWQFGD